MQETLKIMNSSDWLTELERKELAKKHQLNFADYLIKDGESTFWDFERVMKDWGKLPVRWKGFVNYDSEKDLSIILQKLRKPK